MAEKKNIYQKLLEVKKQIPYLKRDTKGFNYEYVSPEQLLRTVNPLLNEQGIILKTEVLKQCHEEIHTKDAVKKYYKGGSQVEYVHPVKEQLYHLTLRMTWVDVETGEKDENLFRSSGMNNEEQGVGSAITYGSRYFIMSYFNIPNGKDDPDSIQTERQQSEASKPKQKSQSTPKKKLTPTIKKAMKQFWLDGKKADVESRIKAYEYTDADWKEITGA